jgi:hypothetical protein
MVKMVKTKPTASPPRPLARAPPSSPLLSQRASKDPPKTKTKRQRQRQRQRKLQRKRHRKAVAASTTKNPKKKKSMVRARAVVRQRSI